MGRKIVPGLILRSGIWHIDKVILGRRVCQSTGTVRLEDAERILARVMEEARQAQVFGVRPTRTFEQAAAKFVREHQHKRSLSDDVSRLKGLMPWIGRVPLCQLHLGTLQPWIETRRADGVSAGTINHGLQIIRRILNLAAGEWRDERGLTWLQTAPKIRLLANRNKRQPYPLSWQEQARLLEELPDHLREMALFAVNTGCRAAEVCSLQWDWEVAVSELGISVFVIPGPRVKNGEDRVVVLNDTASAVVDKRRGKHERYVFAYGAKPVSNMLNSAWKRARSRAGLEQVRVHDLKHTYGRRLRASGVSFEDRQDLLGHRSGKITTHYSASDLSRLLEAANRVCEREGRRPALVMLRSIRGVSPAKVPQAKLEKTCTSRQATERIGSGGQS
jgi:integrase